MFSDRILLSPRGEQTGFGDGNSHLKWKNMFPAVALDPGQKFLPLSRPYLDHCRKVFLGHLKGNQSRQDGKAIFLLLLLIV